VAVTVLITAAAVVLTVSVGESGGCCRLTACPATVSVAVRLVPVSLAVTV
jgi:hypothetical protein